VQVANSDIVRRCIYISVVWTMLCIPQRGITQTSKQILLAVVADNSGQGIPGATIKWNQKMTVTDVKGQVVLTVPTVGHLSLHLSAVGYLPLQKSIKLDTLAGTLQLALQNRQQFLQEVVVTGKEAKSLSTATIITKEALKMLQPSSFSDVLELLPGGLAKDPVLTAANKMRLRETGTSEPGYDIANLGVGFVIDGAPLSTQANMQTTIGEASGTRTANGSRQMIAKGVDLRGISTDNIQEIEIVRGIPSVRYGNLTSGLVKIKRKEGESPLSMRFKADGLSKLGYIGKGIAISDSKFLNIGVDYLEAKDSPTNPLENYKRLTAMVKWNNRWEDSQGGMWSWMVATDLSSTLDKEKKDADVGNVEVNSFRSKNQDIGLIQTLSLQRDKSNWFRTIALTQSARVAQNTIDRVKWVQLEAASAISPPGQLGEHDGIYLPGQYIAQMQVDGKPMNLYLQLETEHSFAWKALQQNWLLGGQWSYDKNNGQGQIFDPLRPISPQMDLRPRAFKSIPATQELSFFLEDQLMYNLGAQQFEALVGLRANKIIGLNPSFEQLGKWFVDPRFNIAWHIKPMQVGTSPLRLTLAAGIGKATQKPVMAQISPNTLYWDLVQLNYYHNNPDYRRVNLSTHSVDPVNYNLQVAHNLKKELRLQGSYKGVSFSTTWFDENLQNGFRAMEDFTVLDYKTYSTQGIDPNSITSAPDISTLPFEYQKRLVTYPKTENGSTIHKQGIEFQVSSPRFSFLNTKFTADGAWFKTTYGNSRMVYRNPREQIIVDGKRQQYLGIYQTDKGYKNQVFNSKLYIDNYFPEIGMIFMTSLQVQWYSTRQSTYENGMPIAYIDVNGDEHPFTAQSATDPALRQLIVRYADNAFAQAKTPMTMNVNFKATKTIGTKMRMAMYVNRLLQYNKPFTVNGLKMNNRGLNSPYFGMEINFDI